MSRRAREDFPGSLHHVINRGIAKRPLFEDRSDVRYFLSRLARESRRGRLQVEAFTILTTHFHLLVRSPLGELSEALRRAQNEYVRHFNRRHRRDGSLVRGRFFSRRVDSDDYWTTLIRYIDQNAVRAGLCNHPAQYPFGSAYHYARPGGPLWLTRSSIEERVCRRANVAPYSACAYDQVFGEKLGEGVWEVIERSEFFRSACSAIGREFSDLVGQSPHSVREWLRRKARLADGCVVGTAVVDGRSIRLAVVSSRTKIEEWITTIRPQAGHSIDVDATLVSGLGRSLGALSWMEIANLIAASEAHARRSGIRHATWVVENDRYASLAADVAALALRNCHGR